MSCVFALALFAGRNLKLSLNWTNAYLKPVKPDVLLGSLERHSGFSSVGGFCCGPQFLSLTHSAGGVAVQAGKQPRQLCNQGLRQHR